MKKNSPVSDEDPAPSKKRRILETTPRSIIGIVVAALTGIVVSIAVNANVSETIAKERRISLFQQFEEKFLLRTYTCQSLLRALKTENENLIQWSAEDLLDESVALFSTMRGIPGIEDAWLNE